MATSATFLYRRVRGDLSSEIFASDEEYGVGDVVQLPDGSFWQIPPGRLRAGRGEHRLRPLLRPTGVYSERLAEVAGTAEPQRLDRP